MKQEAMTTERKNFEMVAKTMQGLEDVLAEELRGLGAINIQPGRRMVSFEGDLEMLYRANLSLRTALRILKPIYKFTARNTDELYEQTKEFDWGSLMSVGSTFAIDTVAYSDEFTHSRFVTYRVKDAIVDWFKDRYGDDKRPGVRLQDADVMLNVHISGDRVTISLDSSGESLHKRGYRVAQTEAPINEVLAAGIILKSGWHGQCPLVDPMCGSGTFLIEAALIAANINPGVYRKHFSFENWKDFDSDLFDRLYNDDSHEREFHHTIYGADMSPKAVEIAQRNIKSAGVGRMIDLQVKPLSEWKEAPEGGILITNPPYGERISSDDMDGLYQLIGNKLKNVFKGYHAWIIGYRSDYFNSIGLAPSVKIPILNGALECELREFVIFEGDYKHFRSEGGRLRELDDKKAERREERRRDSRSGFRKDRPATGFRGKHEKPAGGNPRFNREKPFAEKRRETREDRAASPRNKLEERYRPGNGKRTDRPTKTEFERRSYDNDHNKPEFKGRSFTRNEQPSENPLAMRRSEAALKSITGKQPSLPAIRSRRGWRKTDKE